MIGVDDLVAFLRRCLDDDERVARQMTADPGGFYIEAETDQTNIMTVGAYIYRWTPKRVLAEIEAKRRVIDVLRGYEPNDEWETQPDMGLRQNNAAGTLRALAQTCAGREGWNPKWAL